ncbi:MAG: hypothetical protein AAF170_07040 [Bacteroidota bacterium]
MPIWLQIIVVACTLSGLGFAGFGIWFAAKRQDAEIGLATSELEETVSEQQKVLEAVQQRLQNLEAIVTSQEWDAVQDGLPDAEIQPAPLHARLDLDALDADPSDAERAAQVSRRLKT